MRCQTKLLLVSAEKTRETNARGGRWKWLLAFCIKYKLCTRQPPSSHTHTYHTPLCIISISNRVSISVCCCGLSSLYDTCGSCDAMGATSGVLACRKKNTVSMPCTACTARASHGFALARYTRQFARRLSQDRLHMPSAH